MDKVIAASRARFPLGRILATPGAIDALGEAGEMPGPYLRRHAQGDWGDVDEHDRAENDFAASRYLRLLSVYHLSTDVKVWIITEADRSATTILLPDDY